MGTNRKRNVLISIPFALWTYIASISNIILKELSGASYLAGIITYVGAFIIFLCYYGLLLQDKEKISENTAYKKMIFVEMIIGIVAFVLMGCIQVYTRNNTAENEIENALQELYKNDFSYEIKQSASTEDHESEIIITGEVQAKPYQEHRNVSQGSELISDIYYSGKGQLVQSDILSKDGSWTTQKNNRPYFPGYNEKITILSQNEVVEGHTKYRKYETQYTTVEKDASVTVEQEYYVDEAAGRIVRIVTDETPIQKAAEIKNMMNDDNLTMEEAQKKLEWNKDAEYTTDVTITYGKTEITMPEK